VPRKIGTDPILLRAAVLTFAITSAPTLSALRAFALHAAHAPR